MLKTKEELEKEISSLHDKLEELEEELQEICDYCEGYGEVVAKHKISSRTISPPMMNCPECLGSGRKL